MAANFDTHFLLTGKSGAMAAVMTCALVISSANATTNLALAGDSAP